jgi:hypothetical protein
MININICIGKAEGLNPARYREIDKMDNNTEEKNDEENIWRII